MDQMFVLYRQPRGAEAKTPLAVSVGIAALWDRVLTMPHDARDRRTLGLPRTRDDFAGGEPIHLRDGTVYQLARIDVV